MANTIQHKRGSGSNPDAADLVAGEIAVRTDTGVLFTKKDDDSVVSISGGSTNLGVSTTTTAVTVTSSTGDNITISEASDSAAGVMSVAHHDKLDGIATSATNVTNNNQLTNGAGYITATLTEEQVEDFVGGMVTGNTETGITVTYQDDDGTLDFAVTSQTDNNFTNADHTKLDGIASSANNYSHPSYNGDDFSVDTGALSGATVVSDIDINVTTDGSGHVTDANGSVSTRTLTLADLGYTGATNANNYSHPSYNGDDFSIDTGHLSGATVIDDIDINVTTDGSGHVTDCNGTVATRNLTLANLGYTGATNANNYSHPSYNGDDFSIDTGHLSGATVIDDIDINVTTDSSGHVTDCNGTVATRNLTLSDLGYTGDAAGFDERTGWLFV